MTLCEPVWKLHPKEKLRDCLPGLHVSALAVLYLQCDGPSSSTGMVGGHRISELEESACVVIPGAICRWDVAFQLLFEEPSDRIFGFIYDLWQLDDALILKSKSRFGLYRNDPENITVLLTGSGLP